MSKRLEKGVESHSFPAFHLAQLADQVSSPSRTTKLDRIHWVEYLNEYQIQRNVAAARVVRHRNLYEYESFAYRHLEDKVLNPFESRMAPFVKQMIAQASTRSFSVQWSLRDYFCIESYLHSLVLRLPEFQQGSAAGEKLLNNIRQYSFANFSHLGEVLEAHMSLEEPMKSMGNPGG